MKITVLGGGISGLTAAYYLSFNRPRVNVNLYETASRFGGWIQTETKDGRIFEVGPRTIRPKALPGNTTLELIESLGLKSKIIPIRSHHIAAKNRLIYAKNRLCLLPTDVHGVLNTIPPFSKPLYKTGIKELFGRKSKTPLNDESIYDFTARRFGKEVADYLIRYL